MDIRHLRLFMTVVECGNITAAAEKLGLSQPALSKHLSRLEGELQTKLLERLPRGVRLSTSGQILFGYAKSIDASYRSALRQIDDVGKTEAVQITVGSGFFWLNGLLPRAIALLVSQHPGVKVNIVTGVPSELKEKLLRGDLELVFGPVAASESDQNLIASESLIRSDSQVIVRQGHPAADGTDKSIKDLYALDWVMPTGTFVRTLFDQVFQSHGLPAPEPRVEVNDISCTLDIVAHSDLATMATSLTPLGDSWESFDRLNCSSLSGYRETGILRRRYSVVPQMCENLCDILRNVSQHHQHAVHRTVQPLGGGE